MRVHTTMRGSDVSSAAALRRADVGPRHQTYVSEVPAAKVSLARLPIRWRGYEGSFGRVGRNGARRWNSWSRARGEHSKPFIMPTGATIFSSLLTCRIV